ncbi:lytic transglycosylase domain-containing protein [Mucilaginibacter sp.]
MIKTGMIKKHLITCSVMFVLVIISRFAISDAAVSKPIIIATEHSTKFIFAKIGPSGGYNFANEALPVNDARVNKKLRHSIKQHNFLSIQSNVLQFKAQKLFPIIEPILRMYGIPEDFKYIPLVESGLCSGISPKGAAGIWQFMPGTARTYGLKVGHGIDERLNVRKSTIAACKYIKELYGEFNSWTLAAAAYNNGEIKLQRQITKQNQANYFRMHLNRETGVYIYNLIAMKEVISKPVSYGFKPIYANTQTSQMLAYN